MKKLISFILILTVLLIATPSTRAEAAVKISKSKATLEVDAMLQLEVNGTESTIKWASSKETIATVSKKGLVTAVKAGTATITATVDSKDYSCTIYVVNSKNVSVAVGETMEFTSGEYIVGEDITAGTYTLEITDGYGAFFSYISESEYDKSGYNYKNIWLSSTEDNEHEKIYKNLKLKKDNYIIISDGMIIDIKRTK